MSNLKYILSALLVAGAINGLAVIQRDSSVQAQISLPRCGDRICDPLELELGSCPADCSEPVCGDGICDPLELELGSCPVDCAGPVCGDGICEAGEAEFCPTDCIAVCGNGLVETGEQCDDGNTSDGDCCSSTCQFEPVGNQTCGIGACQATTPQCSNGVLLACTPGTPAAETCDGIDNDCNGFVDDGPTDVGQSCTTGLPGLCSPGTTVCAGSLSCVQNVQPSGEVCDAQDNDCDGQVDEDFVDLGDVCSVGIGACQADGVRVCSVLGLTTECSAAPGMPSPEVCDAIDNDCDGVVDEPGPCVTLPSQIRIYKWGSRAVPGRNMIYLIYVENLGNAVESDLLVSELLDMQVTFLFADPTPITITDVALLWDVPPLAPGEGHLIIYKVHLAPTTPLGQTVIGPACASNKPDFSQCFSDFVECDINCNLAQDFTACWNTCQDKHKQCVGDAACDDDDKDAKGPIDPNEKGVIANTFIQPDQTLVYPIHFENIGDVEARDVFVTDVLEPNLDESTLEFLTPNGASFDAATRTVRWDLLGRNLQPGETDNVILSIQPLPGLPSGTEIRNSAEIQFEMFEPLVTPEVVNIIDTTPPSCTMDALPGSSRSPFPISWQGTDFAGDVPGEINFYAIFASVDGGGFTPFLTNTNETEAVFDGELGKTYAFICIATDAAGNVEAQESGAETQTLVLQPPHAKCQDVEVGTAFGACTAPASVDNGSFDPNGDPITLVQSPGDPYGLGNTVVTLEVTSSQALFDTCTAIVTVVDRTPPNIIDVSASPSVLWPPNHKMVAVEVSPTASDLCDTAPPTCTITGISSNEAVNARGDGNTAPDWEITGDLTVNLRAERSGGGNGRVYTMTVGCTDASGNSSTRTETVTVPHDQGKKKTQTVTHEQGKGKKKKK